MLNDQLPTSGVLRRAKAIKEQEKTKDVQRLVVVNRLGRLATAQYSDDIEEEICAIRSLRRSLTRSRFERNTQVDIL